MAKWPLSSSVRVQRGIVSMLYKACGLVCCLRLLLLHAKLLALRLQSVPFSSGSSTGAAGKVDDL